MPVTTPSKRFATAQNLLDLAAQLKEKYTHDLALRAGASGGTSNAATTSGNTYLNLVDNGSNKSGVKLSPGDNMSIVSDGVGNVTFQATNTTYGLSLSGRTLSLVEGGSTKYVGLDFGTLARDPDTGEYDPSSLAALLSNGNDGHLYGVSIPKGLATACTKTFVNASFADPVPGIVGRPAVDPYVGVGAFRFYEVNATVDPDGTTHVYAIRGIDNDFRRDGTNGDVFIMTPVLYWSMTEETSTMELVISDTKYESLDYQPHAKLPDGTVRPYMLYAKYVGGMYNGRYASVSGVKPRNRDVSHDSLITICQNSTTGYSAKTVADDWYVKVMFLVKYATKNSQSVMRGCTNYSYQYAPAVAETGVKRVILTNAQAANLVVGSAMMLGTHTSTSTDRNTGYNYDVFDGLAISAIEAYNSAMKAVYFDTEETFDTDTTYLLSTSPWHSGSCDDVIGDGSMGDNLNGKYPFVIQGIECMVGLYEVVGNVIIKSDGSTGWIPFINYDSRNETTSVTANCVSSGKSLPVDENDSWKYPLYPENGNGLLFGTTTGGSTSSGVCDGHYTNKVTTSGTREWLSVGHLDAGGLAGVWCVNAPGGLSNGNWVIGSRLGALGRSSL